MNLAQTNDKANWICLLGGTFDPPHYGHLQIINQVRQALGAQISWLVPNGQPAYKQPHAHWLHRLAMCRLLLQDQDTRTLAAESDNRTRYSNNLIAAIKRNFPNQPCAMIIGYDQANNLDSWHNWQQLTTDTNLIIIPRDEQELNFKNQSVKTKLDSKTTHCLNTFKQQGGALIMPLKIDPISSTLVRKQLASLHTAVSSCNFNNIDELYAQAQVTPELEQLSKFTSPQILYYILKNKLYTDCDN